MAVSVFPERMNKLDPEDVGASLRTIEDYIGYITERTEYALTNTFRTSSGLGSSSQSISVELRETADNLALLIGQVGGLTGAVTGLQDEVAGISNTISQIQGDITSLAERVTALENNQEGGT